RAKPPTPRRSGPSGISSSGRALATIVSLTLRPRSRGLPRRGDRHDQVEAQHPSPALFPPSDADRFSCRNALSFGSSAVSATTAARSVYISHATLSASTSQNLSALA